MERGYLQKNPIAGMSKLIKVPERKRPILNTEQTQYLLDCAFKFDWHLKYAVSLAVHLGLRASEIYGLRFENCDFTENVVTVCEAWNKRTGLQPYTKNRRIRRVPMNPEIRALLLELEPMSEGGFVVGRNRVMEKGEQARELRAFCRSIGLPEVHFHVLRSVFITTLLQKGVSMPTVMSLVGHRDFKTTMVYLRVTEIQGSTDVLSFRLNGGGLKTGQ